MSDTAGMRRNGSANGANGGASVDQLLLEAGLDDDSALRPVLLDLQSLAAEQPAPSAAVAALMTPGTLTTGTLVPATPVPATDELAARRRAKRRVTLTTLSVAVSLAAGGAVAAASDQGVRDSIGQVNHAVTSFVATVGGAPAEAPMQAPAPLPDPAGPGAHTTVPTTPPVTHAPAVQPGSGARQNPQPKPSPSDPAGLPLPDLRGPGNITSDVPGAPALPLKSEGQPPVLPLPTTPPVRVPGSGH